MSVYISNLFNVKLRRSKNKIGERYSWNSKVDIYEATAFTGVKHDNRTTNHLVNHQARGRYSRKSIYSNRHALFPGRSSLDRVTGAGTDLQITECFKSNATMSGLAEVFQWKYQTD